MAKQLQLEKDTNAQTIQLPPGRLALSVTYDTTISSATHVALDAGTQLLEVTVPEGSVGVFLKFEDTASATNVTTSVFDEFIALGSTRHYQIPSGMAGISVVDSGNGESIVIIQK